MTTGGAPKKAKKSGPKKAKKAGAKKAKVHKKSKKVLTEKTVPELRKELKRADPHCKLSKHGKPLKKSQLVTAIKHAH